MNTSHDFSAMTHLHISPIEWQDLVSTIRQIQARLEQLPHADPRKPSAKNPQPDLFYTRKEAAKILRISLPTLGSYIKQGTIEARFIDRRVLIPVASVENFGMTKK
jgi:excisionase family DNA binding protein